MISADNSIEIKNVDVSFYMQHHGVDSLKKFILSMKGGKMFVKRQVLAEINLEIKKGECFGILGRNGSGKSTLLRVISGIIKPDSGSIEISGSIAPMLGLGVGLEPERTGLENIGLCCTLMGMTRKQIKASEQDIIDFSELTMADMKMQVKRYSSGMIARLGFSIAVASKPEILVIDEALAVGDLGFRDKCYNRIEEIKKSGSTIVFVSQIPEELKLNCDRGAIMNQGRIIEIADINTIADHYNAQFNH